jgi:type IV secretory pathway VirB4 component
MAVSAKASQEFVPVKEVRDGIVVLKDGSLRAILLASSINLSLKSYDEQQAVLLQFQNFLNSIDFSMQIVIQSRRRDMRPYLAILENRMREQTEPLLKVQTREYIEFIRNFTESVSIMSKSFFIVVPYSAVTLPSAGGVFKSIFGGKQDKKAKAAEESASFEEKRSQLEQRIGTIQQGLSRLGVRTAELGTEEVVELFYKIFNPGEITASIKTQ